MIPIPPVVGLNDERLSVVREKALQRYAQDLMYRQNVDDAYLLIQQIHQGGMIPAYRLEQAQKDEKLFLDAQVMTTPDVNNLADLHDSVSSLVGKLENVVKLSVKHPVFPHAQQRVQNNLHKVFQEFKENHHIDKNPTPTPQITRDFMLLIAPLVIKNTKFIHEKSKKLREFINKQQDVLKFIQEVVSGQATIAPEQGRELMSDLELSAAQIPPQKLSLSWQLALEQDLEQSPQVLRHLIQGDTQKLSQSVNVELYKAPNMSPLEIQKTMGQKI